MRAPVFAIYAASANLAGGLRRQSKALQAEAVEELASLTDVMSGKISVEKALYPRCDQYTESFPDYSITCGRFLDKPKFNAGNTTFKQGILNGPGECMETCNADEKCRGFEYTRNHIYLHGSCTFFQVVEDADGVCTHLFPFPLLVYVFTKDGMQGECGADMPSLLEKSVDYAQGGEGEGIQNAAGGRQVTKNGCTCKSNCKSDIGTRFRCDTCKTEGKCGTWSPAGRWDYCDYRPASRSDFISQPWDSKMSYFWKNVVKNTTHYPKYPLLENLLESVVTVFDNYMPEMPAGREKMIHSVGSVCQFELDVSSRSPYTGLLGAGKQRGLIRLGSAVDPRGKGITPGIGIKFPRSGVPDGDFVLLHTLDPGDQWDFFYKNQSTHTAPTNDFPVSFLVHKFREASDCVFQVGVSDLARYSQSGREHSPRFPFKIMAAANPQLKTGAGELSLEGIHKEIDAFPVGTVLYSLWACGKPSGDEMDPNGEGGVSSCGDAFKLGDIRTTSQCTTSWYGDASLHFRHQRIEEDWKLEPSFMRQGAYDVDKVCLKKIDGVPPPPCGAEGMLNSDA